MAEFRKYALAFAGLACVLGVAGNASAQGTQYLNGFSCNASATPFDMRAEGLTEQAGDLTLACTGGNPTQAGTTVLTGAAGATFIPQVNFTIAANTNVTSRLVNGSGSLLEALLLINEPGPGGLSICPTPQTGCQMTATGTGGSGIAGNPTYSPNAIPGRSAYNGFQGILTAPSQVTFFGVPLDPPANLTSNPPAFINGVQVGSTSNVPVLTLRITNVRVNAAGLGVSSGLTFTQVNEFVSSSAGFTINNSTPIVGNVRRGLVQGTATGSTTFNSTTAPFVDQQCVAPGSPAGAVVEYVNFQKGFGTAFKLQSLGATTLATNLQATTGNGNNTESQFIPLGNAFAGNVGRADWGTRVKLTFTNVPAGVTIYVPTSIGNSSSTNVVANSLESFQLIPSETGQSPFVFGPGVASAASTSTIGGLSLNPTASGAISVGGTSQFFFSAVTLSGGTGIAVYELTAQSLSPVNAQGTITNFQVPVLATYTASPATNSPGLGLTNVAVDFAPTSTVTTANSGNIPRFVQSSTPLNGFTISACQTVLLFPFVTNLAGFDTGIAISNTSTDPFGTTPQTGTCTLNFYGAGQPAALPPTGTITSAAPYTTMLSSVAPGFQGYLIAQCRFQYGHGFAFITDGFGGPGRGLSEGYLALVIPDPGATSGARRASPLSASPAGSGENLGQ